MNAGGRMTARWLSSASGLEQSGLCEGEVRSSPTNRRSHAWSLLNKRRGNWPLVIDWHHAASQWRVRGLLETPASGLAGNWAGVIALTGVAAGEPEVRFGYTRTPELGTDSIASTSTPEMRLLVVVLSDLQRGADLI